MASMYITDNVCPTHFNTKIVYITESSKIENIFNEIKIPEKKYLKPEGYAGPVRIFVKGFPVIG